MGARVSWVLFAGQQVWDIQKSVLGDCFMMGFLCLMEGFLPCALLCGSEEMGL